MGSNSPPPAPLSSSGLSTTPSTSTTTSSTTDTTTTTSTNTVTASEKLAPTKPISSTSTSPLSSSSSSSLAAVVRAEIAADVKQPLTSVTEHPKAKLADISDEHYDDKRKQQLQIDRLLEERDQEISTLKAELARCRIALEQITLKYRLMKQRWLLVSQTSSLSTTGQELVVSKTHDLLVDTTTTSTSTTTPTNINQESDGQVLVMESTSKSSNLVSKHKVLFKTGTDDEEDDDDIKKEVDVDYNGAKIKRLGAVKTNVKISEIINNNNSNNIDEDDSYDLDDIMNDVGEIDLNLDIDDEDEDNTATIVVTGEDNGNKVIKRNKKHNTTSAAGAGKGLIDDQQEKGHISREQHHQDQQNENDEEEEFISDGLFTSLTDAAISNLSQLAALQERCESQHQHQKQSSSQTNSQSLVEAINQSKSEQFQPQTQQVTDDGDTHSDITTTPLLVSGMMPTNSRLSTVQANIRDSFNPNNPQDPFTARPISSQAAIALNAAAAAAVASGIQSTAPILPQQQQHRDEQHLQQRSLSPSSSISPNSTIQGDLSNSHSLASVVAAAAVAAAAANADQNNHLQHHHHPLHNSQQQSRLISSSIPSPEFYHNLQQSTHAQNYHHHLPPTLQYPISSTSVTPSPSSLMAQSVRRSLASSNTTTASTGSIMSPISSPNFLRRQFMPDRTMPILTPSPSSGMNTGTSSAGASGASPSLAHLLQHHHHQQQQQRSASAMTGSSSVISPSPSCTPISASGGSTNVSPMMSNKNLSQARLNNMQIRHKFGYLGSGRAQFNSPHGFCLGLNQEIVVADTNNHRICIFDKSGTYINQFGTAGKEDGQLWNPRKVAILFKPTQVPSTTAFPNHDLIPNMSLHANCNHPQGVEEDITEITSEYLFTLGDPLYVVCDRGAKRSRMQLFTKDGAFIKKICIHYIDIVAGLAITNTGLIIVVDSVSPTVYVINGISGILSGWFDCSSHMKEPSDIAVKSDPPSNDYYICDFKGHCVIVFSESGHYLRKIGHDGLTSYPNGIDISDDGDILVGDSHGNRFHVVVFDRNGNFVSQFECPHVKVSRCCGLKITREGYIVTLAKNNHHVLVLDTIHI